MPKYVYLYKGGSLPDDPEEARKIGEAWAAFTQGLGEAIIDGGNRFVASKTVNGSPTSGANGYTILSAASLEDAIEKARPCPVFASGGDVEVSETVEAM